MLRHAKSSWDDPTLADHDRPLSQRGRRSAQLLADHFSRAGIRPELVLCSSAVRARQTLTPISAAMGLEDRIQVDSGLFGATAEQLLARVRAIDRSVTSVLVIGHNPGLQDLAVDLASADPKAATELGEKFPTGAMAVVLVDGDSWSDLSSERAHVASVIVPRQLRS